MFFEAISKIFIKLRYRYNFERAFQLIFGILGFIISIALIVGGLAAVPFTGGASLLPVWLGWLIFSAIFTTVFLVAGRMLGIVIDTIISAIRGEKINNEKLGSAIGCVVGIIIAVLAWPLHFFYIPYVVSLALMPLWEAFLIFIPVVISMIATVGRNIGRVIDVETQDNIVTSFRGIYEYFMGTTNSILAANNVQEEKKVDSTLVIMSAVNSTIQGIEEYKKLDGSHLNSVVKLIDPDTGKKRAEIYLFLLQNNTRIEFDLQRAIILYTMLEYGGGPTLKQEVKKAVGEETVRELDNYINSRVEAKDKGFNQNFVISKLKLFADSGLDKDEILKDDNFNQMLNNLVADQRFRKN